MIRNYVINHSVACCIKYQTDIQKLYMYEII